MPRNLHREILRHALTPDQEEFLRLADEISRRTAGRRHTPSEVLQREGREER